MEKQRGRSRRRSAVMLAAIALVGVAVLTSVPAGAQADVHVFWSVPNKAVFLNFEQPALRLGDRLASRGPLLDATKTSEAGRAYLDCVVMNQITDDPTEGPGGLYRCSYLLRLAEGDLIVEGLDPHGPGVYTFAVLGGTGVYAGATGDATLTDTFEGTEFVIDLTG